MRLLEAWNWLLKSFIEGNRYLFTCIFVGTKLSFVLKLDECQIVKGQWLERMSVTFMTEAMDMAFGGNLSIHGARSKPTFSVQTERDIWWLGAFEVPKETHEVLAFVFNKFHGLAT